MAAKEHLWKRLAWMPGTSEQSSWLPQALAGLLFRNLIEGFKGLELRIPPIMVKWKRKWTLKCKLGEYIGI